MIDYSYYFLYRIGVIYLPNVIPVLSHNFYVRDLHVLLVSCNISLIIPIFYLLLIFYLFVYLFKSFNN
jgi:hypothetical protein